MRLMLVFPSAAFSTYDVARGLRKGLLKQGQEIAEFHYYRRLEVTEAGLKAIWPSGEPGGPPMESVCSLASEGLLYQTLANGCRWIVIVNGMGLHPDILHVARQLGIRVACWFTESPYESKQDAEFRLAETCDVAFTNERTVVDSFPCAKTVYLPHAFDPEIHYPREAKDEDRCDAFFLGTGFSERHWLFEGIDWTDIDLRIGGFFPGIMEPHFLTSYLCHPCTDNERVAEMYAGAKIVLNPHRFHETAESANPRVFEVAACGGFQIADYRAEIADVFGDAIPMYEPGVTYRLQALVRHYLDNETARLDCAERALHLVQEYTFEQRAKTIMQTIEEFDNAQRPYQLEGAVNG